MDLPDAEDMPQVAYGSSTIPYDVWSTEEHHHWHVSNKELCSLDKEEKDVVGRRLDKLSNCPNLEVLDQACKDLDLGQDFRDYGVAIAGADVVISLSTSEKDTLILPSDVLIKASPWFRSALDDRWISNKVTGIRNFNGQDIIMKRFELECDNDHGDQLFGKTSITTDKDRVLSSTMVFNEKDLPKKNEIEHFATIIANKIALSIICDFPVKLDDYFLLWEKLDTFDTLVVLKLLQWFSTYLVPLGRVAHAIIEFIFNTEARDQILRNTGTYLRISYVLQSRELFTATLYACDWEFHLSDIFPGAGGDASLFCCVASLRVGILKDLVFLEEELLRLRPRSDGTVALLARNIWVDWLVENMFNVSGYHTSHEHLATFARGEETAQELFERMSKFYELIYTSPIQIAAIVASLEDILDRAVSITRKYFTEMTDRVQPDSSFYAINIEASSRFYTPWSPQPPDRKQDHAILAHLVETAQLQYGETEPAV